jgi:hypothetical protein
MLLQQRTTTKPMKKLLLMAVAISGLALFPAQRSSAQVFVGSGVEGLSFGFPNSYYAHRGILIITTGILYGRMSAIRSRIITVPRTPDTARGPTTANITTITLTTAIKPEELLN